MDSPRPELNARAERFCEYCEIGAQITLIGPMLPCCPHWPDGPLMFVDGGARWRSQLPRDFSFETLSLGDGDSLGSRQLDILLDTDKSVSDLGYALEVLQPLSVGALNLLGFLGGRRDHEWINIGVVANFLRPRRQLRADFDTSVALFSPGDYSLYHRGLFSLVHFQRACTRIHGAVDYPLDPAEHIQAHSSLGLSNCAHGEFGISSDAVTVCFFGR